MVPFSMKREKNKNGIIYESFIYCFRLAALFMRHKPHLNGKEHLEDVPMPVIFTITHDSYFEVPSLSKVYKSLKPRPVFTIMAKNDFLSGKYLSTNFGKNNSFLRAIMALLDKTGLPKAFLKKMNLITIHRPFIDSMEKRKEEIKKEISEHINYFKEKLSQGFSTLIFPEGTTWGYGGIKKIRSAAYQLVDNCYNYYQQKVHILPINVKVDRLVKGTKDIFINVGSPLFVQKSRDEFNQFLFNTLQKLHTITFSQIAAYYLKRLSTLSSNIQENITLTREHLIANLNRVVERIHTHVQKNILPAFDMRLIEKEFLCRKVNKFIRYCVKMGYLNEIRVNGNDRVYILNKEKVLAQYPARVYRKLNPVGFHANELKSLGEETIDTLFN
jgi:1-acyl-sn-glycerol-3-phosphate acyltransferase